jgi:hypothetical protein
VRITKTSGLLATLLATVLLATGCGGGGGGGAVVPAGTGLTDSFGNVVDLGSDGGSGGGFGAGDAGADGTGGEGPPLPNAAVVITDSTGKTATAVTNADGYYRAKITGMTAPLVVRLVAQNGKVYTSLRADAIKTGFNTVNITSFTDKIASNIAIAAGQSGAQSLTPAQVTAGAIAAQTADLKKALLPALTAAGVSATLDFIATPFVANGTNIDQVLDLVRHEVTTDGSTRLYTKKPTNDSTGAANSAELSASNTLQPAVTNELDFTKLKALQTKLNQCFALTQAQRSAASPNGCDGFIHDAYLQSSMSFGEQLRQANGQKRYNVILSAADLLKDAVFEIPELLAKFESTTGSGNFDIGVVELRWFQPADNSYRSMVTNARRFAGYVNPAEANAVSKIGADWWLYGNQRVYDSFVTMRARSIINLNPATNASTAPSENITGLGAFVNGYTYFGGSGTWVANTMRSYNVKGPGLPAAGLTYARQDVPNACNGPVSLVDSTEAFPGLLSATATTLPALTATSNNSPWFWVQRTSPATGAAVPVPANVNYASPTFANLSAFNAWNLYTFVVLRSDGSTVTFTARNVAAALPADALRTLPLHDLSGNDASLLIASKPAAASVTVNWVNNPAMPGATQAWLNSFNFTQPIGVRHNAEKVFARGKTSQTSASSTTFTVADLGVGGNCNNSGATNVVLPLDSTTGTFQRNINLRTTYNRVGIDQQRRWQN